MYKFSWRFYLLWTAPIAGTIANLYFMEQKVGIANWPIGGKKQYSTLLCSLLSLWQADEVEP